MLKGHFFGVLALSGGSNHVCILPLCMCEHHDGLGRTSVLPFNRTSYQGKRRQPTHVFTLHRVFQSCVIGKETQECVL